MRRSTFIKTYYGTLFLCMCGLAYLVYIACAYFTERPPDELYDLTVTKHALVVASVGNEPPGHVTVRVLDTYGNPIEGKEVRFSFGIEEASCRTDRDGAGTIRFPGWFIQRVGVDDGYPIVDWNESSEFGALPMKHGLRILIVLDPQHSRERVEIPTESRDGETPLSPNVIQHITVLSEDLLDFKDARHAFVVQTPGDVAGRTEVCVMDLLGYPVADAEVTLATDTQSETARTNSDGNMTLSLSGDLLSQVKINNEIVLDEQSSEKGKPTPDGGLRLTIILLKLLEEADKEI